MGSIEVCVPTLKDKYSSSKGNEHYRKLMLVGQNVYTPKDNAFSKRILRVGHGKISPTIGAQCQVFIRLLDDIKLPEKELGKYKINEDVRVKLGETDGVLSDQFDRILMTMKEQEYAYIKVNLNYSDLILAGTTPKLSSPSVGFNVVLKEFNMPSSSEGSLETMANSQLSKANEFLKIAMPQRAISRYQRVLTCLGVSDDLHDENCNALDEKTRLIVLECFQKLVQCYTELYDNVSVIKTCTDILKLEPSSHEFILKRGQAYAKSNQFGEAIADLDCLLKLDPTNEQAKLEKGRIEGLKDKLVGDESKARDRKDYVALERVRCMNAIKDYLEAQDEGHACWRMQLLRKYAKNSNNDEVIPEIIREYEEKYFEVLLGNTNTDPVENTCAKSCMVEKGCDDLLVSALEMALEYDAMCSESETDYSSHESSASTSEKDVKEGIETLEITESTL